MRLNNLVCYQLVQAVTQAVGLRLLTAEAWFQSQGSPYGNFGEHIGTRSGVFFDYFEFTVPVIISRVLHFYVTYGQYIGLVRDLRIKGPGLTPYLSSW